MTDQPQPPPLRKPKSLLETHQDEYALIQALNEYAASQQKPVSQDAMSDLNSPSSSRPFLSKSTPSDLPEPSSQDHSLDKPSSSADPYRRSKPKEKQTIKFPFARRRPATSEQPSVSKLLELGVKVRDFAYESTLPPVPTVYLQPRQIQPSVPKDVNDPNDPHYVLEEERKKKVYTFESTRKVERTPTEPLLESDMLPPPPRTFPKIKRTNAQLDLDSQPQSQPVSAHQTLPYDITNTPLSASQPIPGLNIDSQEADPWVHTPFITPNGSLQWPEKPAAVTSPSTSAKQPMAASCAIPETSGTNLIITASDSQALSAPETMSYSRMGFAHPDSQMLGHESNRRGPSIARLQSPDPQSQQQSTSALHEPSLSTRPLTPVRVESPKQLAHSPLVPTSPVEPSPTRGSPRTSGATSPILSHMRSPSVPILCSSKLSPEFEPSSPSSSAPAPPRYNLRNKSKRRADSPSPRLTRARVALSGGSAVDRPADLVSAKSMHLQNKAPLGVISTGRTLKRSRDTLGDAHGGGSISTTMEETRRSKRRNKAS